VERLRRTEVGGLPVWWAPAPGPLSASLAFRVGTADERLAQHGITHLLEHLVLFGFGRQAYVYNASVGDHDTVFDVRGAPGEVLGFLHALADRLHRPPRDRFGDEVRVLLAEGLTRTNSLDTQLRRARYGAQGYGLRGKRELGLRGLTPGDVEAWARAHFTRDNAVLWMTGEPPADLELALPPGTRRPMPAADPIARLALPAYLPDEDGLVAAAFVAGEPDAEAVRIVALIARDRLYDRLRRECALVYDVDEGHGVVGPGQLHVRLSVDCRDEDARTVLETLLDTLGRLAGEGPTREELAFQLDQARRYLEDPTTLDGRLMDVALDELHGLRPLVDDELADAVARLTPERAAQALQRALGSMIVMAPESLGAAAPEGLADYAVGEPDAPPLEGRAFREMDETECLRRPCELVVGAGALHWRAGDGSAERRVPFDEVAAVVREAGDAHVFITTDDRTFEISPLAFHDGDALRAAVVAGVGEERIIPLDDRGRRVEELGAERLRRRELLTEELYRVSRDLAENERLVLLVEAEDMDGPGLLALTDRRLIWHYVARGAEGDEDAFREVGRDALTGARAEAAEDGGILRLDLDGDGEPLTIDRIWPAEDAARLAEELGAAEAAERSG